MREIKFRAWDKENSKMIYEIPLETVNFYGSLSEFFKYTTLMQYTGLKDKNGVEIYEGDLVVSDDSEGLYGEVSWNEPRFGVYPMDFHSPNQCRLIDDINDNFNGGNVNVKTRNLMWLKVIGNIYENKELSK